MRLHAVPSVPTDAADARAQVFGFDVMPDANGKPWLLEVNCDPQMTTDCPLDLQVESAMPPPPHPTPYIVVNTS